MLPTTITNITNVIYHAGSRDPSFEYMASLLHCLKSQINAITEYRFFLRDGSEFYLRRQGQGLCVMTVTVKFKNWIFAH